jgi:putative membrane protein
MLKAELLLMALYAGGVTWLELTYAKDLSVFRNTLSVHSLIGFIMGLVLVFRTNSAYDRWWEGRKLWGSLVNQSRSMAIKIKTIIAPQHGQLITELKQLIIAYPYISKEHLRQGVDMHKVELPEHLKDEVSKYKNKPNAVTKLMYERLVHLRQQNIITDIEFYSIENEVSVLPDIMGACERIRSTPIPFSYSLFIKKFIFIYVITLPFGLIPSFGYWTVPITLFIFYVMVSLEILAEEIEDPFGDDDNDLPTDELAGKIEDSVTEIFSK